MSKKRSDWFLRGIQQIGVGVPDAREGFRWARRTFGMDVPIFDDAGEAPFMTRYTGGTVHSRHAILAANLHGGAAFEIWQFTSRSPSPHPAPPELGDLGIFCPRMKSPDVRRSYERLASGGDELGGAELVGEPLADPAGDACFYLRDPQGLTYEVVGGTDWFNDGDFSAGGVSGCMIGVSDIERSRRLYSELLGYDELLYDEAGRFADFAPLPAGDGRFRRVLLGRSASPIGPFSRLTGVSRIELVQALERSPRKLYENRYWGDIGFIQLCFDLYGMEAFADACGQAGFPVTVDSADSFDMGDAAGRFCYIEDPDGTLIEFVETQRIPILRKIGWYLNLERRDPRKPLPAWMVRALGLARVKD